MKSQFSLSELASQLEANARGKQDYVVDTRSLEMGNVRADMVLHSPHGDIILKPNDVAHGQISARLGIPLAYYKRMREETPNLLAENVNTWFKKNPEQRMVRTIDTTMRAFLSNRYQRIENDEIASVALPQLIDAGAQVMSTAITESRMYIKAVFPRVQGEVVRGDVVQAGVVISNSEVGQGAVKIQPLVYRLVCANGMIAEDAKYTARHVGGRVSAGEDIVHLLTDETLKADDKAILLKVRDVVRAAANEAIFNDRLALMQGATTDRLVGNPAEAVKVLSKRMGFSEFEQGSILRHLIEGGDVSRWGVLNAVTRTAQDVDDYDRATELETMGGNILHLPRAQWQELAIAA